MPPSVLIQQESCKLFMPPGILLLHPIMQYLIPIMLLKFCLKWKLQIYIKVTCFGFYLVVWSLR